VLYFGHAHLEEATQGNAPLLARLDPAPARSVHRDCQGAGRTRREAAAVKQFLLDDEQRKRLAVREEGAPAC
jgi:hypothetical protein